MADSQVISTLNSLIKTCEDGEAGFQTAAQEVTDQSIRSLFTGLGRERAVMVGDLRQEVLRLGGTPADRGGVSGAIHRGWMHVKGAITRQDDAAIVSTAESGEDTALAAYHDALRQPLPPAVEALVGRQHDAVKRAHDRVLELKRALKPA